LREHKDEKTKNGAAEVAVKYASESDLGLIFKCYVRLTEKRKGEQKW